jgi:acetylornithine deacetylase/succinyl-diaminopimelate desuccinylase-like protein
MRAWTKIAACLAIPVTSAVVAQEAPMPPLRPDQTSFLALYKELVETNTTLSSGSCTSLAEKIAAHLRSAGFTDQDITPFSVPDHPREGGLVADIFMGAAAPT